jgi:catechol 2,3-dioxygenase-like lactoylglutathione lyase family enzyme
VSTSNTPIPAVLGLHHFAWRCRDAEETRHFYEDLLGLPLVHVIRLDRVPSTGEYCPYVHLFFEMADGSNIAFFDLGDNTVALPSPNTPPWVNHLALRLATLDELETMKQRLAAHGVEVLGVTDHHFVNSIYFFDPNGIRLELTVPVAPPEELAGYKLRARPALDAWTAERQSAEPETRPA